MDLSFHQVLKTQTENERTILEYLNEDCWHAVLKYLSVKEILRTERTSKHWQRVMLAYLYPVHEDHNVGASVVSYKKYCNNNDFDTSEIELPGKNFLNLEEIHLIMLMNRPPPNPKGTEVYFPCLKQICLDYCKNLTDECISQFLGSTVLEELKILTNVQMTGLCLVNLKSEKLKSLVLRSCWALELPPILAVADRFSGLTKLALARASDDIRDHVHLIIDKLPKLEYLTVLIDSNNDIGGSNIFFESICRLSHLRHLSSNFYTWDHHLFKVMECCKELEVLKLYCWNVTGRGRGAAAVRSMGPRLRQLDLAYSSVTDDDVLDLVCACPNLTSLRLTACERLRNAVTRVAAARREQGASTLLYVVIEQCYSLGDFEEEEIEDVVKLGYRDDENDSDGVEDSY